MGTAPRKAKCRMLHGQHRNAQRRRDAMAAYWIWWALAALLVAVELTVGTFYLLAVGVAFAIGGVAAWMDVSPPGQLVVAGVLCVVGTIAAHRWRMRHGQPPPSPSLDIG